MDGSWNAELYSLKKDVQGFLQKTCGDIFDIGLFPKSSSLSRQQYSSKSAILREQKKALDGCMNCALHLGRKKLVFGSGSASASLLLVGPPPRIRESEEGLPFLGEEKELLDKMLRAIHLEKDDVYTTSIVKCPARGNLSPSFEELRTCLAHLNEQVLLLQPCAILTMGEIATQTIFNTEASLANIRGVWQDYQGVPTMATWGPRDLIVQPHKKREAWGDLQALHAKLVAE